ncbi:Protein fam49a [Rhizopus azygosporus]|uniref:Protein fam49a n=1 Tax=Rhizopus azygosporus TaxID=86630 RepID=A0A367IUG0_RHIAZ|nr:Protein fam49a [Rhizopus azygosporus]
MGQLLSSLNLRGNSDIVPEIGFDIENAAPSPEELEIYNELHTLLIQPTSNLLQSFKQYEPASDAIRDAIATPSDDNEDKAWNAVLPTVNMLRTFYSYSSELGRGIPILLNVLCKDGTTKDLDRHPGLTKLFADLLDFVFEFDYLKIRNPTIQNDFSFYRRTLQRGRSTIDVNDPTKSDLRTAMDEDDLANRISLFIAYSTPMLKCVIDTTTKYVKSSQLTKSVGEWLSSIWAVCYQTLYKKKYSNEPTLTSFCLKVMVVSIILYDHIDPQGAFSKYSPINVKNSLKIIQSINTQQEQSSTINLISALRYNSKHLNDESTPKGIKNMIMATS